MAGIRTCRPLAPERSFLMAIDRHDNNGSAVDDAPAAGDRCERQAGSFPREMTGDRPVPDERRSRSDLYSALRDTDAAADHHPPSSPDAPRTTKDGGWEWKGLRLGPEANRVADEELSARRTAEGRSGDGSYRDRGITPAMRRFEAILEHGTLIPDTEKFALKSPDRFKEKLAKLIERYPDRSPEQLSSAIHDGIRYTFIFDNSRYVDGVGDAQEKLTEEGYTLKLLKPRGMILITRGSIAAGVTRKMVFCSRFSSILMKAGKPNRLRMTSTRSWPTRERRLSAFTACSGAAQDNRQHYGPRRCRRNR